GIANIARWIPFMADDAYLRNQLRNKMIRPTTIPQSLRDLQIEQAVAREALRLAFEHHKSLARGLKGVQTKAGVEFEREATGKTLVNMIELDMIIGSGGVLSHAPERAQSALMMLDAYQPEGVTMLAVDSIFMMPQLGVLSTILPEAATQVFERDCLIKLGHVVAPIGTAKEGEPCLTVAFKDSTSEVVPFGQLRLIQLKENETQEATITPARNFDVGAGKGKPITVTLEGGVVGLILDTRGRPVIIPSEPTQRVAKLQEWLRAIGLTVHTGASE
ncbi:MAG: Methylaspartate mutase, partial [Capsulimonas sp.]|nr:Methylaspartate mutase [Capsulimonas sp.]